MNGAPLRCALPAVLVSALAAASPSWAEPACRTVEVRFLPRGLQARDGREAISPQIAVWVEDPAGQPVADVYVTRLVGLLGLGNRPGQALLKSDFRWPYGRRPMALPVWAHRRGKTYPLVVMGGKCSRVYDPKNPRSSTCNPDFTGDPADDDTTIAYHGPVSSDEPFYCSPSGWRTQKVNGVDVVSCASSFYGSKGWFAPMMSSVYPPRADLSRFGQNDHPDVMAFAGWNDVAAVSAATPPAGQLLDPPVRWQPPAATPDGDYVLRVEVHLEGDFNTAWPPGKSVPEPHAEWNYLGHEFLGQPSIVYAVPFRLDDSGRVATTLDYEGYGDWRGDSGAVHPPDGTISQSGGSGADRLAINSDDNGRWRVKASVVPCGAAACAAPTPLQALDLTLRTDSTVTVGLVVPAGEPVSRFEVRYLRGTPVTEANFDQALPAESPTLGPPGDKVYSRLWGLQPQTKYYLAARARSRCGLTTPLVTGVVDTSAGTYTTLSGCFVATAAYGSELDPAVQRLRRLRDERLLPSPLGQALVASYYALSPPLAAVIAGSPALRAVVRRELMPLLQLAP